MLKKLLLTGGAALLLAAPALSPALAQSPRMDPTASASAQTGMMTADQVGVAPMTGTSTTDYVNQAGASDMYEIAAGKIAAHKAKRKDIKGFGEQMVKDHTKATANLMSALNNAQRKIAPPSDQLPTDKQAMVDQLNAAPRGVAFDNLYLSQQLQAHQQAWALHKGYAVDGDDSALRAVASQAVPVIESHLTMIKSLQAMQ